MIAQIHFKDFKNGFECIFSYFSVCSAPFEIELFSSRIGILIALFITHCNAYSKDFNNVTNITADF